MQQARMTKLDMDIPDDWFIRADDLVDHITNHTDAGATCLPCGATVMRLAILRGLAQLEAERDALANPERRATVVVLGGRPWPYAGEDDETVSLTAAGEAAVEEGA
jgi:hypothetical protein